MNEFKATDKWYKDAAESETGRNISAGITTDDTLEPGTYNFLCQKDVGKYIVNNNLTFAFNKKPSLFHRCMTKLLLGWKWKDNNG